MQALRRLQASLKTIWPVHEPRNLHPPLEEGPPTPTNTLEEHHPTTSNKKRRRLTHTVPTSSVFNHTLGRPTSTRPRKMTSTSSRTSAQDEERQTITTSSPTNTTPQRSESPWQDVTLLPKTTHAKAPSLQDTGTPDKVEKEGVVSATPARAPRSARSRKAKGMLAHLRKHGTSMVLKNTGSVARDHLASERTFLSYVRTSLALASMGVALVQLFTIAELTSRGSAITADTRRVQQFARPLGITTVAFSLIVLMVGAYYKTLITLTCKLKIW